MPCAKSEHVGDKQMSSLVERSPLSIVQVQPEAPSLLLPMLWVELISLLGPALHQKVQEWLDTPVAPEAPQLVHLNWRGMLETLHLALSCAVGQLSSSTVPAAGSAAVRLLQPQASEP